MRRLDDHAQHEIITACDLSKPPTAPSLSSYINAVSPSYDHTRHIAFRIRIRVIENQSNKSFVRSSPVRCKCGASAVPVDSSLRRATDRPIDRPRIILLRVILSWVAFAGAFGRLIARYVCVRYTMSDESFHEYKARKEAFVSNLTGTTREEVFLVGSIFPAMFFLFRALRATRWIDPSWTFVWFVVEFLLFVVVPILGCTLWADYAAYVAFGGAALASLVRLLCVQRVDIGESRWLSMNKLPFISVFRSGIMMYTCIAILAVDFHIYPRRFAKTETYGTSLMDLGVGAFVFSGGLVSRMARNGATDTLDVAPTPSFVQTMKHVGPMVVLGLGRLATTKGIEYQEHVSEYGVHW